MMFAQKIHYNLFLDIAMNAPNNALDTVFFQQVGGIY